jgi:hypothetical protein
MGYSERGEERPLSDTHRVALYVKWPQLQPHHGEGPQYQSSVDTSEGREPRATLDWGPLYKSICYRVG